jgi:hypothetical protein
MNSITIDVHGMTVDQAKREIERFITSCEPSIKEVVVIHGFHRGDALRQMIQSPNGIRSKRIKRKRMTMNRGETIFELF